VPSRKKTKGIEKEGGGTDRRGASRCRNPASNLGLLPDSLVRKQRGTKGKRGGLLQLHQQRSGRIMTEQARLYC